MQPQPIRRKMFLPFIHLKGEVNTVVKLSLLMWVNSVFPLFEFMSNNKWCSRKTLKKEKQKSINCGMFLLLSLTALPLGPQFAQTQVL